MKSLKATIGLVGEKCGGKETACKFLEMELGHLYSFVHHRFSDTLVEVVKACRLPITRENLQKCSPALRSAYGPDVLANSVRTRVLDSEADIVTLDGLRWKDADVPVLRSLPNNFLIYITAPVEIRYARARLRSMQQGRTSYSGEGDSFDKFLEEEKAITEIEIPEIAELADFRIDNTWTFDDLRAQIRRFIAEKLQIKL
ncbi:hypothetical protein A2833_00970 [Candidatus Azambacteria bacterium RIFCSPHIGHO2_01_FULL_44_55]|uniref:(d)CMP kinase n=1 Tax=Candidatus Azambacteria bacterium RIFCSPLOWO2_02_FULL_44_14 TaxID=1797306 RepID=A0A1F5CCJ0_9BACT|nr:MAG: hypothetical protein A3C78_01750 [Candidatus Azambacteria bacterium RIFCSPHIGHO2_02_FULL_45_18]OGD40129.1 MAG: hypothetical protein A2833_00970 [Candidatus Azambacteria bacterium RIFCSPHIGHO2_01_FULL_44_55]OGD40576.1 MAG: hypothetical protein A3I30_02295 [Candidatus Azambacteria bacterium RIFCSPLOWO2_02_FULL_44_14]OGD49970.1 MAG: hypothetical protein A2608_02085 [Candidatus Azambacteria bacterium RIFOXYD1_FULL_44_10]